MYVTILLVCVLPSYFKIPIMLAAPPSEKPSRLGLIHLALDVFGMFIILYGRFYIGLPLGYELTLEGFRAFGTFGGCFFGSVLLGLAPLFFLANLVTLAPNLIRDAQRQLLPSGSNRKTDTKSS